MLVCFEILARRVLSGRQRVLTTTLLHRGHRQLAAVDDAIRYYASLPMIGGGAGPWTGAPPATSSGSPQARPSRPRPLVQARASAAAAVTLAARSAQCPAAVISAM